MVLVVSKVVVEVGVDGWKVCGGGKDCGRW